MQPSIVSRKMCRAAAAATEHLEVNLRGDQERSKALKRWLDSNGQHVTSLQMARPSGVLEGLPCPQLRQLDLGASTVELYSSSSSHPGFFERCSGLTRLLLSNSCVVFGGPPMSGPDSLAALSAVPALQHLELRAIANRLLLPGSVLHVLTHLTYLALYAKVQVTAESLQHISALQHLKGLVMDLPSGSVPLSPSSTPGLAQLTGLRTLHLVGAKMDPAVLQHYTQLQDLSLKACSLLGTNGTAALLMVIGKQLQLQQLTLTGSECEHPVAAAAFTALTTSSKLQELTVCLTGQPPGFRGFRNLNPNPNPPLNPLGNVLPPALAATAPVPDDRQLFPLAAPSCSFMQHGGCQHAGGLLPRAAAAGHGRAAGCSWMQLDAAGCSWMPSCQPWHASHALPI